ncbi:hypothetical protein [Thermoproteus tenax]|uniref:hypothetical protein n=1 Tax=Thermoproteus tenax TaxID=2271 RepID=UPI000B0A5D93|nr:hypothetical protein [Thermoproteus tenax]
MMHIPGVKLLQTIAVILDVAVVLAPAFFRWAILSPFALFLSLALFNLAAFALVPYLVRRIDNATPLVGIFAFWGYTVLALLSAN